VREAEERAGIDGSDVIALLVPQTGDLGPHVRAVRDVQVLWGHGPAVVRVVAVPIEEVACEVGSSQSLEVHGEEADVRQHITEPEPVVELETIKDARPVGQAEDVLGEEIALTVARTSQRNAAREERLASGEIRRASAATQCAVGRSSTEPSNYCVCSKPISHGPATASRVAAASMGGPVRAVEWNCASSRANWSRHAARSPPVRAKVASRRSEGIRSISTT
jgi:hypothetical protein